MAARPTAWKYGAHSDPASQLEVGVKAVMLTTITATMRQPRRKPKAPPKNRSTNLRPDSFITQRAVRPAIPAATATAKKMIRNPALSATQPDFRYFSRKP